MAALIPTDTHPIDESYLETKLQTDHKFSEFNILSDYDVGQIVKKSATKSCILDPVPTSLLKEHLDNFIPTLADIINNSLQHGKFPDKLNNAVGQPLLKKENLTLEDKNYWSVSNLSYLGKLVERAACDQSVNFATRTGNTEQNQSAYSGTQHRISLVKSKISLTACNG